MTWQAVPTVRGATLESVANSIARACHSDAPYSPGWWREITVWRDDAPDLHAGDTGWGWAVGRSHAAGTALHVPGNDGLLAGNRGGGPGQGRPSAYRWHGPASLDPADWAAPDTEPSGHGHSHGDAGGDTQRPWAPLAAVIAAYLATEPPSPRIETEAERDARHAAGDAAAWAEAEAEHEARLEAYAARPGPQAAGARRTTRT